MDRINLFESEVARFIKEWKNEKPYIIANTSGSTGIPKEIRLPKKLVSDSAVRTIDFFGIDSNSTLHLSLSPAYIAGKMVIVRSIIAGAELTFESPSSSPLSNYSSQKKIALLSVVGSQLQGLCNNVLNSQTCIENLLIGGSPMNNHMQRLALSGNWSAYESYGMTETASHVALRKLSDSCDNPFCALSRISFSSDSRNCLIIELPDVGKIITNDCVRLIDNQTFYLDGRIDNVIISGGLKIHPETIEKKISTIVHPYGNFYITSTISKKWGEEVVLIVETTMTQEYIKKKIIPELRELLQPHEIPRHIFCSKIKRTETGKIIREKY